MDWFVAKVADLFLEPCDACLEDGGLGLGPVSLPAGVDPRPRIVVVHAPPRGGQSHQRCAGPWISTTVALRPGIEARHAGRRRILFGQTSRRISDFAMLRPA